MTENIETTIKLKKRIYVLYAIFGFVFMFFVKSEADLFRDGNIEWNSKYVLNILGLGLLFGAVSVFLFILKIILAKKVKQQKKFKKVVMTQSPLSARATFFISLLLNLLAYLPFYLAYFPGILAYDTAVQLEQITNNAYNNHHPLFHTLFIKGCLEIGCFLFKSETAGIAIYTAIQILLLASSFAFLMYTLKKCAVSIFIQIFVELFFVFNFLNGYMAVSVTKDTIFTSFMVLFISSFFWLSRDNVIAAEKALENPENINTATVANKTVRLLHISSAVFLCLFRNNGKYALMVAAVLSLIAILADKKNRIFWLKIASGILGALILSAMLNKSVYLDISAVSGDKREMLSVPIQQIARVVKYEEDKLTAEEKALIDEFILYRAYDNYNPVISDPVKNSTNTYVVRYKTGEFCKLYFSLFKKYPGDYINAFLALVGGYVSPFDHTFRIMEVNGEYVTRNYIQYAWTIDAYSDRFSEHSLWPSLKERLDDFALNDGFMNPLIVVFYIPGIYLWIYWIVLFNIVDKKRFVNLMPVLFMIGFFGTLLLGPTMHLRYIYPAMACLPAFFARVRPIAKEVYGKS